MLIGNEFLYGVTIEDLALIGKPHVDWCGVSLWTYIIFASNPYEFTMV